jgi:hypothetical protein
MHRRERDAAAYLVSRRTDVRNRFRRISLASEAYRSTWLEGNKKKEHQELLSTLLRTHNAAQLSYTDGASHWDHGLLQSYSDAIYAADVVLEEAWLFIGEKVAELDLKGRWDRPMGGLRSTHNHDMFEVEFEKIKQGLINAAR